MRSWCYYLSLDVVVAFVLYGGGSPVHLNAARKLVSCQSRIKKIMQKNAEIGRIAMAVPVIICILHTSLTSREKHLLLNVTDDAWRVNYLTRLTEICPWRRWKVFSLIIFEEKEVLGVWDMGFLEVQEEFDPLTCSDQLGLWKYSWSACWPKPARSRSPSSAPLCLWLTCKYKVDKFPCFTHNLFFYPFITFWCELLRGAVCLC